MDGMPDEGAAQKCGDSTRSVGSLGDLEDSASDASGRTVQSARRFDSAVKSSDVHAIRLPGVDVGKPHDRSVLSTVMLRRTVETKEIRPEERTMKLNLFAAWASYFLVLATVVCLGSFSRGRRFRARWLGVDCRARRRRVHRTGGCPVHQHRSSRPQSAPRIPTPVLIRTASDQDCASRAFSASMSKLAGGQSRSSFSRASISSSVTAIRLYHFRSHGTTYHGACSVDVLSSIA